MEDENTAGSSCLPVGHSRRVSTGSWRRYCTEEGCNCHNVLLNVESHRPPHREATINFGIDPVEFARAGIPRAFLDRENPQGREAEKFLRLFEEVLLTDEQYVERLARHRAMVKKLVDERRR